MENVIQYYIDCSDADRLEKGSWQIEKIRTLSLLDRYLPKPPAVIADVGGGAGVYAFPLKEKGYTVHLFDLTPTHIEEANARMQKSIQLDSCRVADARQLPLPDASVDAVLLFGPLYHLQNHEDRLKALGEAFRVLKNKGKVFVAAISRFASFYDCFSGGKAGNPIIQKMIKLDLDTGFHHNPSDDVQYFTDAYFHHPDELKQEVGDSDFKNIKLVSIEGPMWHVPAVEEIIKSKSLDSFLSFLEMIEEEQSILGASAHIMAIAEK